MSKNIQTHFDRDIQTAILETLGKAKYSIRVAMYSLTDRNLYQALIKSAKRGVEVELLLDKTQTSKDSESASFQMFSNELLRLGGNIHLYDNIKSDISKMHNKFCIVDGKIVITGSYNWTFNGTNNSNENIVIFEDTAQAYRYTEIFNGLLVNSENYEGVLSPIRYFGCSKKVVKRNEEIEIFWEVNPENDHVIFCDKVVESKGTRKVIIGQSTKFKLSCNDTVKNLSVMVAEEPKILSFEISEKLVMPGQKVNIAWNVDGASRIVLEPFGEVDALGTQVYMPIVSEKIKLLAYNVWNEEVTAEEYIRIAEIKIPSFEKIVIPTPNISATITVETFRPDLYHSPTAQILREMLREKVVLYDENPKEEHIQPLKKAETQDTSGSRQGRSFSKNSISQIRSNIVANVESVLNKLLTKSKEKK